MPDQFIYKPVQEYQNKFRRQHFKVMECQINFNKSGFSGYCVSVCVRERERERESMHACTHTHINEFLKNLKPVMLRMKTIIKNVLYEEKDA